MKRVLRCAFVQVMLSVGRSVSPRHLRNADILRPWQMGRNLCFYIDGQGRGRRSVLGSRMRGNNWQLIGRFWVTYELGGVDDDVAGGIE